MKKLLSLIILGCLIFGLTSMAMAETTVYLDVFGSGNFKYDYKSKYEFYINDVLDSSDSYKYKADGDLSGYILGLGASLDKFKVGAEYGLINSSYKPEIDGIKQDNIKATEDSTVAELKGGYRISDQEMFKLDLILAVLDINREVELKNSVDNTTDDGRFNFGGNMLGIDFVLNFSKKASLQGTLASSLLGANVGVCDDPSVTEYKLKFNYFVTDNWAVTLGYRSYQYSGSLTVIDEENISGTIYKEIEKDDEEGSVTGFTVGVVYKF